MKSYKAMPYGFEKMGLQARQVVDICSHFEGEIRKAPRFAIVPYAIERRSAAAYYPETNVLVGCNSYAKDADRKSIALYHREGLEPRPAEYSRKPLGRFLRAGPDQHDDYAFNVRG
jgi:hypothetical protein